MSRASKTPSKIKVETVLPTGKQVTSIYLDGEVVSALDRVAVSEQRPRNFIMVRAIRRDLGLEKGKVAA